MRSGTIDVITGTILLLQRGIYLLEQESIGVSSGGTPLKMLNEKGYVHGIARRSMAEFIVVVITHRSNNCTVSKCHHLAA